MSGATGLRGIVHAHSTRSYDGKHDYSQLRDIFTGLGLQFACMTEHIEYFRQRQIDLVLEDCARHSDSRFLYVSNRTEGSVSVIDFSSERPVRKWSIPGGSPDMGGVSSDGRVLWLSGRYNAEVYAIDTTSGKLLARIPVGSGPHGLCVYPQPGRYSLGHTGNMR